MADKHLDCTSLKCPMPVVRVSQAIKEIESGQMLSVEATDPAFLSDMEAWTQTTGHVLLESTSGDVSRVIIQKQ